MMTLSSYYQEPLVMKPLDPDPDKNGKPADHKIVMAKPISTINNKSARSTREVNFRPTPQSGLDQFQTWLIEETWEEVFKAESAHERPKYFRIKSSKCMRKYFL